MRHDDSSMQPLGGDDAAGGAEDVGRSEPGRDPAAYADIGDRVAGVLRAAESAAAEIRADAEAKAERIRRGAEQEAQETMLEARELRTQADEYASDTRLAVEAYANAHRRGAEDEARAIVAAAQDEARSIREAAETMAGRLDEEARARRQDLAAENRTLEDRRRRILEELRDVAAQLEDVLDGAAPGPGTSDVAPTSLTDALSLRRRR